MAIEIKRTPVLRGDSAQAFMVSVSQTRTEVSKEKVRQAVDKSRKILATVKGR